MPSTVQLKNGTILQLENKSFASGGEGDLFKILSPISFQNQVVKIYKADKRTKERENKIQYLASNPPNIEIHEGHHSVIWVHQVVFDNGKFCGFTMPIAKGEKLELLCCPQLPKRLNNEWEKFNFNAAKSIELRLKLCFNIAVAIYHIHKQNHYVLVDMKPENIIVQPNGLISLIDIDSVAVIINNKVIHPAPVATPEYTPPEYYMGLKLDSDGMNDTWDRFSMAIIFYRLLCGIHPFTGSCTNPYEKCNGLADMVKEGLFPNGIKGNYFKVIPPPHKKFNALEIVIQELFKRCFNDGHSNPNNRPNADEWCRILSPQQVIRINRPLPSTLVSQPNYNYSTGLIFTPSTEFSIPHIPYLNPHNKNSIKVFFSGLFGKTPQQKIIDSIQVCENRLRQKEKKYEGFRMQLQNIIIEFNKTQSDILFNEKSQIEHLKNSVLVDISYYDKSAKELYIREANEIKEATTLYTTSSDALDKKVKETYNNILGHRFEKQEIQKSVTQKDLQTILLQEQSEITSLVNSPTKLYNYLIADAAIKNFGSSIKCALANAGIVRASDFIDIRSDGYLKNRLGKWVKANGVGWNRAFDLREWQRKVELKEDQAITQSIKKKFQNQISLIENQIRNQDSIFQNEIAPFQTQYNREKLAFDEGKAKLVNVYKTKLEELKGKFNKLHSEIEENAKIFMLTIPSRSKEIANEIGKNLKNNYETHSLKITSKKEEINKYTADISLEIVHLKIMHQQLNQDKRQQDIYIN